MLGMHGIVFRSRIMRGNAHEMRNRDSLSVDMGSRCFVYLVLGVALATELRQTPSRHQTTLYDLLYASSKRLGRRLSLG